jgi:hypothetical protein
MLSTLSHGPIEICHTIKQPCIPLAMIGMKMRPADVIHRLERNTRFRPLLENGRF